MFQYGGGKKCGRCGKTVYTNEEVIAAGGSWHKRGCFTCKDCNKSLDSNTVAERKAGIHAFFLTRHPHPPEHLKTASISGNGYFNKVDLYSYRE